MALRRAQILVPSVIALIGASLGLSLSSSNDRANLTSRVVSPGKDYYVGVSLVELTETDLNSEPWDSLNNTGPDIVAEIYWKENRIYRSTKKEDTFIAHWSESEIDLRNVALAGVGTSADSLIQGARVNIKDGESIEVRIYDSDVVKSDLAGAKEFKTSELKLGESSYEFSSPGIKRLVLRVSEIRDDPK